MTDEHNPEGFGHEEEHLTELQVMVRKEDKRRRKRCAKRSYGLSGIAKQRYYALGLFAVREGGSEIPSRYAMNPRCLRIPNCFAVREASIGPSFALPDYPDRSMNHFCKF
ncbi:hypothetical protein E3N88_18783 [Mikania micrantha]|uniref:Uncharacterized protein n=1 Tax=Mikania micrantha TaxID=192012 RepID=A0A5N6NPC8_9ASTR|nr:hypothetical protein E3N88_18783 [Mikania micrantha]